MYKDILVPVDVDQPEAWRGAVRAAVTLARTFKAKLHLCSVVPDLGSASMVASFLPPDFEAKAKEHLYEGLREMADAEIPSDIERQLIVGEGKVHAQIIAAATESGCDLIVVGGRSHGMIEDFLIGTNAERVVRKAKISVLVVRG